MRSNLSVLLVAIAFPFHRANSLVMSMSNTRFVTNKMCPYAQKAWIALEASKTEYKMEEISLYGTNGKPKWFRELNPKGTVPVLVCDNGNIVLPDSELILDYLGDDSCLTPTNESEKEIVKMWRNDIAQRLAPIGKNAVLRSQEDDLYALLNSLNDRVVGPYLCGNRVTVADCAAFPFFWRIEQEFGCLEDCKKLYDWLQLCKKEKAFKRTIQHNWWWWW